MQLTLNSGPVFDPIVGSRAVPETHYVPRVMGTRSNMWLHLIITEELLLLKDVVHNLNVPKVKFMIRITTTQLLH